MTPDEIGTQIAERTFAALAPLGVTAVQYPSLGELPTLPCILLHWAAFSLTPGMPEQRWECTYVGQILIATAGSETSTYEGEATLNRLIVPIADAWDPYLNRQNRYLSDVPGREPVDECAFQAPTGPDGLLGQMYIVNNKLFYGGSVTWTAKFRRIAGSEGVDGD